MERIIYLTKERKKLVLNLKEKYLITSELSELDGTEFNIRHFKLIEQ